MSEPYYGWAVDAIEGLRWLADVDEWAFAGRNLGERDPRVIDVAHVRWATTTAVTALDLCAAEIAVRYCNVPFWDENMPTVAQLGTLMTDASPEAARTWVDRVSADSDYQLLRRGARDPLTHRFLVRTALIGPGRTPFEVKRGAPPQERPDARELILLAIQVGERHVGDFGRALGAAGSPPPPRPS